MEGGGCHLLAVKITLFDTQINMTLLQNGNILSTNKVEIFNAQLTKNLKMCDIGPYQGERRGGIY